MTKFRLLISLATCLVAGSASDAQSPAPAAQVDPRVTAADLARIKGSTNAKVWVLIASDFQCPYCREWHETVSPKFMKEFVATGKVRVAYLQFPLNIHPNAMPAAEASMCAGAQNKFWEYHDRLFAKAATWTGLPNPRPVLAALATELKLDAAAFGKCMDDHVMRPMIDADRQRALQARVGSTPSFLVGNQLLSGVATIEELRAAVNKAQSR